MTWNVRKLIFPPFQRINITTRVLNLFDCFTTYYNCMTWNFKNSYLHHFSAQVSQIVFLPYLTVLRLITTVWPEMLENSYLHHFSAQVSQIVFLPYFTVLRLITTVWPERSENSYIRHFSAQVSQIVFLPYLTVLLIITTVWPELSEKSYLRHFSAQSITNRSFSLLDRCTTCYNCMTWNVRKFISPPF